MERKILLLIAAILLTLNVSAQYKEFQFGLIGQPGYSWLKESNDNISNVKNKFSSKYGITGSFYVTENYGFSTAVIIKTTGASYDFRYMPDGSPITYSYNHDFKNTYLQVPVLFKGRTDQLGIVRILGEFGVGLDFLVSKKESYSSPKHLDLKYRTFCPTLMIGLGTEINVYKSSSVLLQVVFDKGLANLIKKTDETEIFYDTPLKTTCLYFEIGFIF